jgi:hypothetical protein
MTPHGPAQIGICKLDQPLPPEARVMPGMHEGEGQALQTLRARREPLRDGKRSFADQPATTSRYPASYSAEQLGVAALPLAGFNIPPQILQSYFGVLMAQEDELPDRMRASR